MHIVLRVGRNMVMAMMAGPPERAALGAGPAQDGEGQLACAGGLKRSMREVPVIPSRDSEHPDKIKRNGDGDGDPADADPDDTQAHRVNGNNGNTTEPVHLGDAVRFHVFESGPRIKPPQKGKPEILSLGRIEYSHVGHSYTSSRAQRSGQAHTVLWISVSLGTYGWFARQVTQS